MALSSLFGSDWDINDYNCDANNALQSYNFVLVVEGLFDIPCKSVRAFKKENEFELIQEGGVNDYVHMRRKPISKPFQFQVERYLGTDKFDIMSLGTDFILPLILCVSRWQKPSEANSSRFYVFMGATVIEKEYSTLDSEKSGLHTETITIAYKELFAANQNFFNSDGDTVKDADGNEIGMGKAWAFADSSKNRADRGHRAGMSTKEAKEGNKAMHARQPAGAKKDGETVTYGFGTDYKEELQSDWVARAKKWKFNEDKSVQSKAGISTKAAKEGSGSSRAQHSLTYNKDGNAGFGYDYTEETQEAFIKKTKLWEFNKDVENKAMKTGIDAKKGKGTQSAVQPVGILEKTGGKPDDPETYGFGPDYKEALRPHWEDRAHLWTFNKTVVNTVTKNEADSKKGSGKQSAQLTLTAQKDGTMGFGYQYKEATRKDMAGKAKLWAFNKTATSKAGLSSESAKKGDGTTSAQHSFTEKSKDGKSSGFGYEYTEELQSVWSGKAEKDHLWKFNKGATNKAGISVPDAKKGSGNASAVAAPGKGEDDAELTRKDFEGKKKLWKFAKDVDSKAGLSSESAKKGDGTTSAQHSFTATSKDGKTAGFGYEYTEDTQETMAGKASMWDFHDSIKKPGAKGRLAGLSSEDAKKGNEEFHIPVDAPEENDVLQAEFETKAAANLWKFSGKAKAGAGTLHLPTDEPEANKVSKETMAGKASMWDFNANANSKAGLSSPDAKKGNDKQHVSANIPDANKKLQADFEGKSSLWKFNAKAKNGNGTTHTSQAEPSANTKSKEDMEGKAVLWPPKKSAVYREGGQDPAERLWPKQKSAVYKEGGKDPEARLWPKQKSAVYKEGGKAPEERLWPKQKSAVYKEGGKNPEERLWPKKSSANYQKKGQDPSPRRYPEVKSAVYYTKGKNEEPRRWPEKKSAVYITDILS